MGFYIIFKKERPNFNDYPELKELGTWKEYGLSAYILNSKYSAEKISDILSDTLKIDKKDFDVIHQYMFARF